MTSVGTPASTRSLILGIRVKFDLTATKSLLWLRGGALWGDRMPQSGGYLGKRTTPRRFFYALFTGAYFTYTGILALAPEPLSHHATTRRMASRLQPLAPYPGATKGRFTKGRFRTVEGWLRPLRAA